MYVLLASQNPYLITVSTVGKFNIDPILVTSGKMLFFRSQLSTCNFLLCIFFWIDSFVKLNVVKVFPLLNPYLPEFFVPQTLKMCKSIQPWKCDPIWRHIPISLLLGTTPHPRALNYLNLMKLLWNLYRNHLNQNNWFLPELDGIWQWLLMR